MDNMGTRIRDKRKELHLTMEQLGDLVGVQKSAVNKWEKGRVESLKTDTTLKLCEVFKCDPLWLTYGYEPHKEQMELTDLEKEVIVKFRTSPHKDAILSLLQIQI